MEVQIKQGEEVTLTFEGHEFSLVISNQGSVVPMLVYLPQRLRAESEFLMKSGAVKLVRGCVQ